MQMLQPLFVQLVSDHKISPLVMLIISVSGLAIMLVIGYYILSNLRGGFPDNHKNTDSPNQLLTELREQYLLGKVNEQEYRAVKARLARYLTPDDENHLNDPLSDDFT